MEKKKTYFEDYNVVLPRFGLNPNFDSWSSRKYNKKGQLSDTSFCVSPTKIKDITRGTYVLKRMFLNSIGLLGEMNNEYSVFHKQQSTTNTRLSKTDKKIIRIHYNDAIKAGMKVSEVEIALNTIDLEAVLKQR